MAEKIVMLALSPTMEAGTIVKWLKKEGDHVATGDILCEVETDKATMDYESTVEGDLLKIVAETGSKIKVGEPIAIAGNKGEDIEQLLVSGNGKVKKEEKKPENKGEEKVETQRFETEEYEILKASPLAREIARQKRIDLSQIKGSGPGGRIIKEDVEKAQLVSKPSPVQKKQAKPVINIPEEIPVSEKRKVIAARLSASMFTSPHYYVTFNVTMDAILDARVSLNNQIQQKVSLNAFLIKFVAEALARHPVINSTWRDETIHRFSSVDIALAVAQSDGLITPVIRNATTKGIISIDTELKDMIERARNGKLQPEEYSNSSFTISNLGSYGVREFTAIINPPGSAILAVGEIFKEPYVNDKNEIKIKNSVNLTLSCDHRVIDGAVAAEFGRDLKNLMEKPVSIFF